VFNKIALVVFLSAPTYATDAVSDTEQRAVQNLTQMMFGLVSPIIDYSFAETDLSAEEVESVRETAALEYAKCQLLALDVLPTETKNEILRILANGENFRNVTVVLSRAAAESVNTQAIEDNRQWRLGNCILGVNEDLGIVISR